MCVIAHDMLSLLLLDSKVYVIVDKMLYSVDSKVVCVVVDEMLSSVDSKVYVLADEMLS